MKKPDWLSMSAINIRDLSVLPGDWYEQITATTLSSSQRTALDASSPTSLEEEGTVIHLSVVHGNAVKDRLPWLFSLYNKQLLNFSSAYFGKELFPCNNDDDAININIVDGSGGRYEWHVDTNPVTGLLFVDDFTESDGGALVFRKNGEMFRVLPQRGLFLCFDARDVPHRVEPVLADRQRISVPMNYYLSPDNSGRDASLSQYLKQEA